MRHATRRILVGLTSGALALGLLAVPGAAPASAATTPRPIVTGWIPYWGTADGVASVVANADLVDDVSPFWYSARGNHPSIYIASQIGSATAASATATLHARGIKVLPTITDGSGRLDMSAQLSTTSGRAAMVSRIVTLVRTGNYDGIDLDWEGFAFNDGQASWTTTRVRWIAFIKALSAALHARGKLLAVTAPAGLGTTSDSTGYWVYAWGAIGPYVDKLRIMAYDYSVSRAGPIAPYSWIEKVVAKAVTQVSSRKIQIGVAAYGRDWRTGLSGTCPNVAPDAATSSSFFSNLTWAKNRHEFSARGAASYLSTLFQTQDATIPGISRPVVPVATWDPVAKEKTFSYQLAFSGSYQAAGVSVVPVGGLAGTSNVAVSTTSGLAVGDRISGTGIPAGATITALGDHYVTLSAPTTTTVTNGKLTTSRVRTALGTAAAGSTTLRLGSLVDSPVGATVTGPGIAAGTVVTAITTESIADPVSVLTLSAPTTAAVSGQVSLASSTYTLAAGGYNGGTTLRVLAGSAVTVGSTVSGTGIGAGAKVTAVSAHQLTLSVPNTAAVRTAVATAPVRVAATCTISRTGWYGEANAALAGANLVGKYQLAGIAQWTIGGEDTAQWAPLRTYATAIAPKVTTVALTAPTSVYLGRRATLRASVVSAGAPLVGATVAFLFRKAGATAWTRVGTAVSAADGTVAWVTPAATASGTWRAYVASTWARTAASAIAAPTVARKASTAVKLTATATVRRGSLARAAATVTSLGKPVVGAKVYFRWRASTSRPWTLLGSNLTNANGVAVRAYAPRTTGYWQATVAATTTRLIGVSATSPRTVVVP